MSSVHTEQPLKTGQIIQGKILKLFPNNKAQIQLGSQTMVAQLEAPLSVGERYHFQVGAADEVIYLKVIGEHLKNQAQVNITELLQTLGLKVNKINVNFVQSLMNDKIPFERSQIMQAFTLLDSAKNKSEAQQILKEMFAQKLPINESVFQSLLTKNTTQLSDQLKAVLQQLRQSQNPTELQQTLLNRLSHMAEQPLTDQTRLITQIIAEANANHQQIFEALKLTGQIHRDVDFLSWKSQWQTFSNQHHLTMTHAPNQLMSQAKLPFPIQTNMIEQVLKQMTNSQTELKEESQLIIHKWGRVINESVIKSMSLSKEDFDLLKQDFNQRMIPLLRNDQQHLERLRNNPVQLRQFLTLIQQYASEQTYTKIEQVLATIDEQDTFSLLPPKDKFVAQLRQMLLFSGITDENLLAQDMITKQQTQTVKSMLIQMIQQGDPVSNDRAQQLLHFINGLQLQSVQEMGSFIQANLVVPGEKLLLNNDIYLEFESKKTDDGKINPDYCRILFYLDLSQLQETVVDMQIQKRLITLTIFNDHQDVKNKVNQLQPLLKKGLESLNYQLATVTTKPLQERNETEKRPTTQTMSKSYEGIEFRI
jgi:hypothetical protein